MKVAYYPGCASHGLSKDVDIATRKVVEERGLTALRDQEFLIEVIKQVFAQEPDAVEKARRDPKVVNYLVGQVMRRTGKRADPYLVNQLVRKMLEG